MSTLPAMYRDAQHVRAQRALLAGAILHDDLHTIRPHLWTAVEAWADAEEAAGGSPVTPLRMAERYYELLAEHYRGERERPARMRGEVV